MTDKCVQIDKAVRVISVKNVKKRKRKKARKKTGSY